LLIEGKPQIAINRQIWGAVENSQRAHSPTACCGVLQAKNKMGRFENAILICFS
jgi:hypothetical protein